MREVFMSKDVAVVEAKKELKELSDFDFMREFRTRQYQRQQSATSAISNQHYVKDGAEEMPKADKLMISFNTKVKKVFGYSCKEIDSVNDAVLSMAIGSCREKAVQVINQFNEAWDGTNEHHQEFKRILRELPVIEQQNLQSLGLLK